jgi:hypothetical protein
MEKADYAMQAIELIPKFGHWLGKFGIVSFAAEGLTIGSIALFPVGALIAVINAYQTGQREWGMRAVAYTTTAFAFNDPIPTRSPALESRINQVGGFTNNGETTAKRKAWKDASTATLQHLQEEIGSPDGDKRTLRLFFQALGDNNRQKLCLRILKGFEEELQPIPKKFWVSGYKLLYPE